MTRSDPAKARVVPVLLTGDVDYSTHHRPADKVAAFAAVRSAGEAINGHLTFYFVAREAQQVADQPRALHAEGHEVGCHGLTHGSEEEYDSMPRDMQTRYLTEATTILQEISGQPVRAFRGPRVKISGTTLDLLGGLGYRTDSTVCSQRCDLVSSNLFHSGWLRAPRLPYRPSAADAYQRGDLGILEVPVSAVGLPFISSALYVLGVPLMKLFFRLLYWESRRTGKPIVYLFHPYEFADEIPGARDYSRNLKVHGLRFRRFFYRGDAGTRLAWTRSLWHYMAGFPGVRFMTLSEYADFHGH
jgi:peptidoglycan/xylan/chitin deacetylase (PgdA/CDA1 family)